MVTLIFLQAHHGARGKACDRMIRTQRFNDHSRGGLGFALLTRVTVLYQVGFHETTIVWNKPVF